MINEMNNAIKIVLAISFFLCLADMPYGFYQVVRFAGLIGFAILSYQAYERGRQIEMIVYGHLLYYFNRFSKLHLAENCGM